jgi:hypothetical protein
VHITDYFLFIFSMLPPDFSNQPTNSKVGSSVWLDGHFNQCLPLLLKYGCTPKAEIKVCSIEDVCPLSRVNNQNIKIKW